MNNSRNTSAYLESILNYAAKGNAIHPCHADTKAPLTARGYYDATNDFPTITAWWSKWPDARVGQPEVGMQMTVDFDPRNGGTESLEEIFNASKATRATFKATRQNSTRQGGMHFKLNNPKGYDFTSTSQKAWPGVDFKMAGKGYCCVPPTPGYTVINDGPRLDVPEEFWKLYQAKIAEKNASKHTTTPGFGFESETEKILDGQRNATLFSMACSLRARGYSKESIEGVVITENNNRCEPPLDDKDVETIISQALKYDAGKLLTQTSTNGSTNGTPGNGTIPKHPAVQPLDSFPILNYEFFWFPYYPFGMVTGLSGKGGAGKGTYCYSVMVANATVGTISSMEEPGAPVSDVTGTNERIDFHARRFTRLQDSAGSETRWRRYKPGVHLQQMHDRRVVQLHKCQCFR